MQTHSSGCKPAGRTLHNHIPAASDSPPATCLPPQHPTLQPPASTLAQWCTLSHTVLLPNY
jgi:hypothetical protein